MIRYTCPSCKTLLESRDHEVGTEVICPKCDLHLRVPMPNGRAAQPPASRSGRKTDRPVLDEIDDEDELHRKPARRRKRFECPRCGSRDRPIEKSEISQTGWILFVVLLVVFWPLCFIGLFQKETYQACGECGARVGKKRSGSFSF
jgi:DNA-directed RNA polymerase subunit M/transcription elongation factor TFIIS